MHHQVSAREVILMPVMAFMSAQVSMASPESCPYTLVILCDLPGEAGSSLEASASFVCFVGVELSEEYDCCVQRVGVLMVEPI